MSHNDPSHDAHHIARVVSLSATLLHRQKELNASHQEDTFPSLNEELIHLAALTHDLTDYKYLPAGTTASSAEQSLHALLLTHGVPAPLAGKTVRLVGLVSHSKEMTPTGGAAVVAALDATSAEGVYIPELAIVQDADRMDAIGAVGVGRCFTYRGSLFERNKTKGMESGGNGLEEAMEHFRDGLIAKGTMMKSDAGKEMAKVRLERIKVFMGWWTEETGWEC